MEIATMQPLEHLLAPMTPATFFEDHWDRRPVVVPGVSGRFAGLFGSRDLPSLLRIQRPRPPEGMLVIKGSEHYTRRWTEADGTPRLDQVHAAWREGYTLVVNGLHELWQPVADFAAGLEEALHHPVAINVYFTPPRSQSFLPHYDVMDVFILQLEGTKAWEVREPVIEAPLEDEHRDVPADGLPPVALRAELASGDVLYIPRGFVHAARTSADASLHLTVGVHPVTWIDLLAAAARCARSDKRFRKALPPAFYADPSRMAATFGDLLREFLAVAEVGDALREHAERTIVARPRSAAVEFAPAPAIEGGTRLARPPGVVCYVTEADQYAMIQYTGGNIVGPPKIASALRYIAGSGEPFTVGSLPDELNDNEKLVLARRLVRDGLLVVSPER
jgi:lysine-specific demethylase/histidyl-hydroxylase NO66